MPKVVPTRLSDSDRDRFRAAPRPMMARPVRRPIESIRPVRPHVSHLKPEPKPEPKPAAPRHQGLRVSPAIRELAKAIVAIEAPTASLQPPKTHVPPRHMPPIDMDLPGNDSPLRQIDSMLSHGKLAVFRRWALRSAVAVVILVLVVGSFLFSQGFFNINKSFQGSPAALKTGANPNLLKGESDGRINILLMGRGGANHDGPDLTDTMMIDSIDVVNHTSTLISIPRDLWVDIPNHGAMKINSAFETGEFKYLGKIAPGSTDPNAIQAGFDEADQTVEDIFGLTIHYNVLLDFRAFQQAVDTVGGVSVNVPGDLVDPTMAWENGNNPLLAKAGVDSFDGRQALNYVRSRETTSDFARAQRQRAVLLALKAKVASAGTLSNPLKISSLFKTFGNDVKTDLSLKNAMRLYNIVKNISDSKITSVGLADPPNNYITTGTLAGQSIALPTAGLFNYGALQQYIRTQLKDPYLIKENARVTILNGTAISDLANGKAEDLRVHGYSIGSVGNAPDQNYVQTLLVDLSHGKDPHTRGSLEQRLGVTATTQLPDNKIQTGGASFVIILGSDEATPQQP